MIIIVITATPNAISCNAIHLSAFDRDTQVVAQHPGPSDFDPVWRRSTTGMVPVKLLVERCIIMASSTPLPCPFKVVRGGCTEASDLNTILLQIYRWNNGSLLFFQITELNGNQSSMLPIRGRWILCVIQICDTPAELIEGTPERRRK